MLSPGDRIYSFAYEQYAAVVEVLEVRHVPRFTRGMPAGSRPVMSYSARLDDGRVVIVDDERIELAAPSR